MKRYGRGITYLLLCALAAPQGALAQAPVAAPYPYVAPPASAPIFNQPQLDQMLAPLALYPDALLSQVLMAATYPTEVVEAARWAQQHPGLTGAALQDALQGQPWDESVKSLCAFPAVLDRMSRDPAWMQQLGDAFIDQQQQVMDTVQALRRRAQADGNLQSNPQQTVAVDGNAITIVPTNPQVVYVPTYNPAYVYGLWWDPAYPPYFPSYWGPGIGAGFFWGAGIGAGLALWGGFDWRRHDVHIDVDRFNRFNRAHIVDEHWHHDLVHRAGVPYRGPVAQQRFGGFRGEERPGELHGEMAGAARGGEFRGGEMRGGEMGHEGGHGGGGRR
jgi:hypothetical protein